MIEIVLGRKIFDGEADRQIISEMEELMIERKSNHHHRHRFLSSVMRRNEFERLSRVRSQGTSSGCELKIAIKKKKYTLSTNVMMTRTSWNTQSR